jgi:hypothetical protein
MSQILQEITQWDTDFPIINKIYLLDLKDNIIAYTNSDGNINQLKKPIKLNKSRRKFIKVNHIGLSKLIQKVEDNTRIFKVNSKDKEYIISLDNDTGNMSCTCTGFTFRGKCKHIEAVRNSL